MIIDVSTIPWAGHYQTLSRPEEEISDCLISGLSSTEVAALPC